MNGELGYALAGGFLVLLAAALVLVDVILEHIRNRAQRLDDQYADEDSHRALMRELRRHEGEA